MLIFWQEPVRTKHPQLLYETKLYRILQGGGKFPGPAISQAHWTPILAKKSFKIFGDLGVKLNEP